MVCEYKNCAVVFEPTRPWHAYCSASCRNKAFSRATNRNRKPRREGAPRRRPPSPVRQGSLFADAAEPREPRELSIEEQLAAIDSR